MIRPREIDMNTTEVATELNTTARTLRKFLRSDARAQGNSIPGKGSRWTIEKKDMRSLRTRFTAWEAAQAEAKAKREAAAQVEDEANADS
jgi:predicted transcriptional regulator